MDWKPWETHKTNPPDLPGITDPPCRGCLHWRPQAKYMSLPTGMVFDGVICCHAEDQQRDFSCFRPARPGDGGVS